MRSKKGGIKKGKPLRYPTPRKVAERLAATEFDKKILIGSVFASDDQLQKQWLDLQMKYIAATTKNHHHVVVLNHASDPTHFCEKTIVIFPEKHEEQNSKAHIQGLNILKSYFMEKRDEYDAFLFIDSDAFPIRTDWHQLLWERINGHNESNKYDIAVPIRFENLETRLHSSILYAKPEALQYLDFQLQNVGTDLIGGKERDIGCGVYQNEKRDSVFILMRSNKINLHPLICGIYFDMFYHHCCGSGRNYNMRSRHYWKHVAPIKTNIQEATQKLFDDPNLFISGLVGWEHDNYAKV